MGKVTTWVVAVASLVVSLVACERPPVVWDGPPMPAASALAPGVAIVPESAGRPPQIVTAAPHGSPKRERRQCTVTMRFANGPGRVVYAAWWTARQDSSGMLRIARSADGGTHWAAAVTAEERDRSVRGCSRPAPAIAVDPDSGYVHLAYYLETLDGSGIFYRHYMQGMFHAPVVIVYGERPVAAAIAAVGDTVVVAYEDPTRRTPQIVLALSNTAGHLFETRVPASGDEVDARAPVVGLAPGRIAVGWAQTGVGREDDENQAAAAAADMVREGTMTGHR